MTSLRDTEGVVENSSQYVRLRQINDMAFVFDFAVLWVAGHSVVDEVRGMSDSADENEGFGEGWSSLQGLKDI